MLDIAKALRLAEQQLAEHLITNPNIEAQYLLAACINKNRAYLLAFNEKKLSAAQEKLFFAYLTRRANGEPLAYITGKKEFWSLSFTVTPDVLIPRPETELLVETILQLLPENQVCHLTDLGTGSGAIALAVASERPNWEIVATDHSEAALAVARNNATQLQLTHITFSHGDWCQPLNTKKFDAIISNPPYIAEHDPALEKNVARYEPQTALLANEDGLADLKKIITQAKHYLNDGGYLLLEHGYQQAGKVHTLLQAAGYKNSNTLEDFNKLPRVTYAQFSM